MSSSRPETLTHPTYEAPAKPSKIAKMLQRGTASWNARGVPRLLYATRRPVMGEARRFFDLDHDIRLVLEPDDYFQCMMFYGRYSPEILETLEHFVTPGDVVLDVGAHIGYFTLHLGRLVTPSGRVYSFEPDPRARVSLTQAVEANRMTCVKTFPVALSGREGELEFNLSPQLGWSTAVKNSHLPDLIPIIVPTVPLDLLVVRGEVSPNIHLVKIDVEGFEMEVLSGMRKLLRDSRPMLVMEVNEQMLRAQGDSPAALIAQVKSFDYDVYAIARRSVWWWWRKPTAIPGLSLAHPTCNSGDVVCIPKEKRLWTDASEAKRRP
ncbi:MAG: FkbM family methyltransferase [Acidobacteria bacterium]|nr:FkbM family methyltransferase [Acidobacteriota bacterium]MBI3657591.1 FkbM family methyltransferase [Acidobacteriota bacterium]